MNSYQICSCALVLVLSGFALHEKSDAQTTDVLSEAPQQFRFFANQLKSNFENIETLKGELSCTFKSPRDVAIFYHDRGNQMGMEEVSQAGDFIKVDTEEYAFTWDLHSDHLVSIGLPSNKPSVYLNAKTKKEVKPKFRNSLAGVEKTEVINATHKISTSIEKTTGDGQNKIYEQTQNNLHLKRGSPKQVFHFASDLTFHDFLFAVARQLEQQDDAASACTLTIEGDLHSLELTAISRTDGGPLVSKFVFDASRSFALRRYEYSVREEKRVTIHEWDYLDKNSSGAIPKSLTTQVFIDGKWDNTSSFAFANLEVNEKLADDAFSMAALGPSNGDFLVDQESGETFLIRDSGKELIPVSATKSRSSGHLVLYAVLVATLMVGLFFVRRRMQS